MSDCCLQWTSPAPLWPKIINGDNDTIALTAQTEFLKPAILRFASDTFMEEFLTLLENEPTQLGHLRAVYENWHEPAATPDPVKRLPLFRRPFERRLAALAGTTPAPTAGTSQSEASKPLKLYQPAHMRYYLLAACLVCQTPGLPDRVLNTARQERVTFVVRRLLKDTDFDSDLIGEYALVAEGRATGWRKVDGDGKSLLPGEEQMPLFPATFIQADGRKRRLLAGLIPVGKREAYLGVGKLADELKPEPTGQGADLKPGQLLFRTQVIEPWKGLVELADAVSKRLAKKTETERDFPDLINEVFPDLIENNKVMTDDAKDKLIKVTREQIQVTSWYILLDFAGLLQRYFGDVWQAITNGCLPAQNALINALCSTTISEDYAKDLIENLENPQPTVSGSLAAALVAISGATNLESVTASYQRDDPDPQWPDFLFPLADPVHSGPLPPNTVANPPDDSLEAKLARIDHLDKLIAAALPAQPDKPVPALPLAAQMSQMAGQAGTDPRDGWFRLRCVLERPYCDPRLSPALVSEPTVDFQIAGFFDPDAPARPIRIGLPLDTTPAGLRKFDKNTAFMISDVLCGQINRARGLGLGDLVLSVLPWPFHKDLPAPEMDACPEGRICALSIPIITICALILLMIFVSLFDAIFHWLPYFIQCFPLPKFLAKEASS